MIFDKDFKPKADQVVGSGIHGIVYKFDSKFVVKVNHPWIDCEERLEYEFRVQNDLYNQGRNVPFPVGIFYMNSLEPRNGVRRFGFMMQYLQGISGEKTEGSLKQKVKFLYQEELDRCRKLGYTPIDFKLQNSFYVPKEDKVYLLDFRLWI